MTEIFVGDGQSPIGDFSGMSELAPPIFHAPPIPGEIDFDFAGGQTTSGDRLMLRGAGNMGVGGWVRLVQYVNGLDPYAGRSVITSRRTRLDALTTGADLDQAFSRSWTDPLVDVGTGELQMLDDDPDLSGFELDGNDVIQFSLNDELSYSVLVEQVEHVAVAPDEEAAEGWKLSGRGHMAVLERALVYPTNGVRRAPPHEDRVFNWTEPSYYDAGWSPAHIVTYILWVQPPPFGAGGLYGGYDWGDTGPWDANFSDQTAAVLWSSAGSTYHAPSGTVYGRQWFYMDVADDHAYFQGEGDDRCDFYLNGQLILSTTDWMTRLDTDVSVPAGWNLLATACANRSDQVAANPAGWAWALWDYGYPPNLYAHSSDFANVLAYPAAVPSLPVGAVMRLMIEEANGRGALPYITLGFTDTHDSAGKPWPTPEISTKVGTDLLTFFTREIGETYADLYMPPGSTTLYAWNKGTRGKASGLTLTPGDNLTALVQNLVP